MTHKILHLTNCFHRFGCTGIHNMSVNGVLFICLVPYVTTLILPNWRCCSVFFNVEAHGGGINPHFRGLLPKLCQTVPYGFPTRLRLFRTGPLNTDTAIQIDPGILVR